MKISKEISIALVAVVGLIVLFFGIKYLKGMSLFSSDTSYYITFKDISGLSESSPIYVGGYRVGVVKRILFDYTQREDTKVEVGISPELRIPEGSSAEIVSDLLGNLQVNLLLNTTNPATMAAGSTLNGTVNSGAMGQMKDMIPAVERMLPKLDSIMVSLNALLADPSIAQSLHNVEQITGNLTTTTAQLNTLMAGMNKELPGIVSRANGVLDNTAQLTGSLAQVDVAGTMAKVDATLSNVQQLTAQLNNDQGSLGLLMRDPALYNHLSATARDADSLLINLRAQPKRYVHFSLFGSKTK